MFDLEGTLVQTIEDDQEAITEFRARTREKLVELGIPSSELEGLVGATLMRNKALEYVEKHFSSKDARRFHVEADRFFKKYEMAWANQSRIFPDTLPALRELKRLGCKMGVVTNTSREAAGRELCMHSIAAFFETVVTREDAEKLKPDPEGIFLALKRLNAKDFFFIGDLVHDSRSTRKAGGISIIVCRGSSSRLEFDADYIVRSLIEVPSLIGRIRSHNESV